MNVPEAAANTAADPHQPVKAFKPVTVLLTDNNDTLEGFLNLTSARATPAHYDHQGAAMYVVAVILVYGLSMVLLIGSLAKKNMKGNGSQEVDDRQVSKYLNDVPHLIERSQRDKYKELKHNIVQIVNSRALVPLPASQTPAPAETNTGGGVDVEGGLERLSELKVPSECSEHAQLSDRHIDDTLPKQRLTDLKDSKAVEESNNGRKVTFSQHDKRTSPENVSPGSSVYGTANETSPLIPSTQKSETTQSSNRSEPVRHYGRQKNVAKDTTKLKAVEAADSARLQQSLTASWGGARVYESFNSDPLAKSFASSGYHSMHSPVSDNEDPVHAWLHSPLNASGLHMAPSGDTPPQNRRSLGNVSHSPCPSQCSSQTDLPASAFSCACPAYGNESFVPSSPQLNGQHTATQNARNTSVISSNSEMNPWRRRSEQSDILKDNSRKISHTNPNGYHGNSATSPTPHVGIKRYPKGSNHSDQRHLRNGQTKVSCIPKVHVSTRKQDMSRKVVNGNRALTTRVISREPVILEATEKTVIPAHENQTGRKTSDTLKTSVQIFNSSKYPMTNGSVVHNGSQGANTTLLYDKSRDSRSASPRPLNGRTSLPTIKNHLANGLGNGEFQNRNDIESSRGKSNSLPVTPQSYSLIPGHPSVIAASPSTRRAVFRESDAKKTFVLRSLDREMGESYGPYSRSDVSYNSQYVPAFFDSESD